MGQEGAQTMRAGKMEASGSLVEEVSDLTYRLIVLLVEGGVRLEEIATEMKARRQEKQSGE